MSADTSSADPKQTATEELIAAFSGIRPMAKKLDIPVTTVQGWKKRQAIPTNRHEEIAEGASPQHAINSGYGRAFVTIMDANITTLLVAVILYAVGTGPVRGFAVTLSLGIITSMFTAIMGTRALVNLIYGRRRVSKLSI